MIEIIAYHGWAFNSDDWSEWDSRLSSNKITFRAADRGYFSRSSSQDFKRSDTYKILFCHSFGLHWVPDEQLIDADALVLFNSFKILPDTVILGTDKSEKLIQAIRAMELKLLSDPYKLLSDFRQLCGLKNYDSDLKIKDERKLQSDLKMMRSGEADHLTGIKFDKLILFEADEDPVVPESRLQNFKDISNRLKHHSVQGSGHALPFTHLDICISLIKEGIPILNDYESGKYHPGK